MQFYHAWFAGSTAAVSRLWCGRPAIEHRQGEHGFYLEPGHHVGPSLALDMTILEDDLPHERLEHLGRHANVSPLEFLESLPLGGEPSTPSWDLTSLMRVRAFLVRRTPLEWDGGG